MDNEIKPGKIFNTAGLCFPEDHYMVNPVKRLTQVKDLIEKKFYFTLHAPRQTGKTTYLYALSRELNAEGKYTAMVVSFERAGYKSISLEKANETIISAIYISSQRQLDEKDWPPDPCKKNYYDIYSYLSEWSKSHSKPIVLFVDEIDSLFDDVLVSILRQFRDGYQGRPKSFPSSIVLVGLRDVRDYKIKVRPEKDSSGTASPFNVKSESVFLKNFSREEVFELLEQHTTETGQVFPLEVKEEIFRLSQGQPWLVNALARQIVFHILNDDYSIPITLDHVRESKNQLILRRDTHLDNLVEKLREDRVKRIAQAIVNGDNIFFDVLSDDILYVRDLGLVSQSSPLKFANPIYAEIIPRMMAYVIQETFPENIQYPTFLDSTGNLDMEKILKEFQFFYRRNSEAWISRYEFKESAQHLLLMAFLQRIVNSGGEIIREMAVGNGRIDMLVRFKDQEFPFELKIKLDRYSIPDGKQQLAAYMDKLGLSKGFLVVFDPGKKSWKEKLYFKTITVEGKQIVMVGL